MKLVLINDNIVFINIIYKQEKLTMIQTPKKKLYNEFASPIGLLKKYSSTSVNPQQRSLNTNDKSIQDEFYRIKAERIEAQLLEYKEQNTILRAKLADSAPQIQILKEKIYTLENNSLSQQSQTQRSKPTNNAQQVEKLLKQIRIVKNQHEISMAKVRDENKKLHRKVLELTNSVYRSAQEGQQQKIENRKNQDVAHSKLEEQNKKLRDDIQFYTSQKQRHEEKSKKLQEEKKELLNELQELRAILGSKNRYQEKYDDLLSKYEQQSEQLQQVLQENREFLESKNYKLEKSRGNTLHESSASPIKNDHFQDEQQEKSESNYKIRILELKVQQQESLLEEKNNEIKNILQKLKPLLIKQKQKSWQEDTGNKNRASLSILEVFLKKYKITSF